MKLIFSTIFLFLTINISFTQDTSLNVIKESTIEYVNSITDKINYVLSSDDPNTDPFAYSEDSLKMTYHEDIDSVKFVIYGSSSEIDETSTFGDDVIYIEAQETPVLWLKDVEINKEKLILTMMDPEEYNGEYYSYYILMFLDSDETANRLADILRDMVSRIKQYRKAMEDKNSCDPVK
ncbi:hypothetical protein [Mangrovivirga cuniculi]|uniref:Uncharacterized protein n=1 Tax=Mangrovivirga cuniculi TaxID=2715131 RepID=A0A4D7K198_9BACT|nr:hypothetical protein [Mangrovivirga cuniculi]QCK16705.1 hypothetical protein DCC35_19185 [Mangrovivirga cuniculi]